MSAIEHGLEGELWTGNCEAEREIGTVYVLALKFAYDSNTSTDTDTSYRFVDTLLYHYHRL